MKNERRTSAVVFFKDTKVWKIIYLAIKKKYMENLRIAAKFFWFKRAGLTVFLSF